MTRESVDALLNPSLKVSRPVAACARCRSAKIKCDGALPACSACQRAGKVKECSSANDEFARGKERNYVAALESAVQRLQAKIDDREAKLAEAHRHTATSMSYERPVIQQTTISNSTSKEASDVNELVSDFGLLTVNATSRDFHGVGSTMSFAKLLKALAIRKEIPTPTPEDRMIPSRYITTHPVNWYFENFYVTLPFLSETNFMSALSRLYQESRISEKTSRIDIWTIHLVLAIAAASLSTSLDDEHRKSAVMHMSCAMAVSESVLQPGSIAGLQALLLLVQYSLLDFEYFDSWYLIGMAARLLVDLGLHCEPGREMRISKHDLDSRRRIFYCTYALDRLISISYDRAFSFTDDSAPNVLLPTLSTDHETSTTSNLFLRSVRPALFLFDIRRVQSAYYQRTRWSSRSVMTPAAAKRLINSALSDVEMWQSSIPRTCSQRQMQAFRLEYLYSQILVTAPSGVIPVETLSQEHKSLMFHRTVQYCSQLYSMVSDPDAASMLTVMDYRRAEFVAQQFTDVIWADLSQAIQVQASRSAPDTDGTHALDFIARMTFVFDVANRKFGMFGLCDNFARRTAVLTARLMSEQRDSSSNAPDPGPVRSGAIKLYADAIEPPSEEGKQYMRYSQNPSIHPDGSVGLQVETMHGHSHDIMNRSPRMGFDFWQLEQQQQRSSPGRSSELLPRHSYGFEGG